MAADAWPPRSSVDLLRAYDLLEWDVRVETANVSGTVDAESATKVTARCSLFDAVSIPFTAGMHALVRFDRHGLDVPCFVTDRSEVTFLIDAGTGELLADLTDVTVLSGPDAFIALPPTPKTRWDTPPWADNAACSRELPSAQQLLPVVAAVLRLNMAESPRRTGRTSSP